MLSRYTILPYKANTAQGQLEMIDDILRLLADNSVPLETQKRIRQDMSSGRLGHSTYGMKERAKQEEVLRNDPTLLVKLLHLYHHDYVLFGMPIKIS